MRGVSGGGGSGCVGSGGGGEGGCDRRRGVVAESCTEFVVTRTSVHMSYHFLH